LVDGQVEVSSGKLKSVKRWLTSWGLRKLFYNFLSDLATLFLPPSKQKPDISAVASFFLL
jgi:hypothetical protein